MSITGQNVKRIITARATWKWTVIIAAFIAWGVAQASWWTNFGTTDTKLFIDMLDDQSRMGLLTAYSYYNLYYPPFTAIVFYPLTTLIDYTDPFYSGYLKAAPIKVLILICYQLSWVSVLWLTSTVRKFSRQDALFFSLLFVLNIYFFESAIVLAYLDILGMPALVLCILAAHKKAWYLAGILLSTALMFKLLPLLIIPLVIVYVLPRPLKWQWKSQQDLMRLIAGAATVILPLVLIFGYANFQRVLQVNFGHSVGYLSFAFNFPQILKYWLGPITPETIFQLLRYCFYTVVLAFMLHVWSTPRRLELLLDAATALTFVYFTFMGGVHENHLFLTVVFALLAYTVQPSRRRLCTYLLVTLLAFLNLFIPYGLGLELEYAGYKHLIYFLPYIKPYYDYIALGISVITIPICVMVVRNVLFVKPQPESSVQ